LADTTQITLRPVGPDDRGALADLFARLGPESRRARFFLPKPELSARELTYFTDIDHRHHEAIAAIDQRDDSFVGVARYVGVTDRAGVAEVAIEVADTFQRRGIGTALTRLTIQRAHANGLTLLTATTLWENRAARGLLVSPIDEYLLAALRAGLIDPPPGATVVLVLSGGNTSRAAIAGLMAD